MRPAIIPPKLPIVAKPKLKLPPPRAPFRVHLERAAEPLPPVPMRAPAAQAAPPRSEPAPKRPAPRERPEREEQPMRELDSAARTATLLAPPPELAPPTQAPVHAPSPPTVNVDQQLAIELVEKASFWGDGTRGLARLRFNGRARAGLANATVTLEHDGDETHLRVEGIDPEVEQELRERLAARGVTLSGDS